MLLISHALLILARQRYQTRKNARFWPNSVIRHGHVLSVQFPHDFKTFLREMNGTDLATLNVYGSCGEPHRKSVGVYSYPRDIELIRQRIEHISSSRAEITSDLAEQGFELLPVANLVPVDAHRYVVCSSNLDHSIVLSIAVHDVDAIVYANSLKEYLEKEFLQVAS